MVAFVDDHVAVIGDAISDHTFADETLNDADVNPSSPTRLHMQVRIQICLFCGSRIAVGIRRRGLGRATGKGRSSPAATMSDRQSLTISGTSMASPFVTGTAALVIQLHPTWKTAAIKSAIMNSANPDAVSDYQTRRLGAGVVNAAAAVGTQAYAFADRDEVTLNFGLEEFSDDLHLNRVLHIKNDSRSHMTFHVAATNAQGSPHSISLAATTVNVPAHGQSTVQLTFSLPAATAGDSFDFREAAGLIAFTPDSSSNRGISLRVPYYIVPRVSANVTATLTKLKGTPPSGNAIVENHHSPIDGTADFYAWGLESKNGKLGRVDVRAAGVQSLNLACNVPNDRVVVFAVNTFKPWSAPSMQEFDVFIDTDDDGVADFDVFSDDFGLVTAGEFSGEITTFIINLHTGNLSADFDAVAPTDASTILLPVCASSIAVSSAHPRFSYTAATFDLFSPDMDQFDTTARFNAFNSAISNGQFEVVAPNATVSVPVSVNPAEFASTPAMGLMIVTQDDKNGVAEANLLKVKF
jgi:minor extracellular serine protease Vpr